MVVHKKEIAQLDSQTSAAVLKPVAEKGRSLLKLPETVNLESWADDFRVAFRIGQYLKI